jgi:hypothetical protein
MRHVHAGLGVMLLGFAALQYNDPDWYYWTLLYLLAAMWSLGAAWRSPRFLSWPPARLGAVVSIVLFLIGFASLAPTIDSNWIHVEEAREGFGYLICAVTTTFALWESRRRARLATEPGTA